MTDDADIERVHRLLAEHPEATREEIANLLLAEHSKACQADPLGAMERFESAYDAFMTADWSEPGQVTMADLDNLGFRRTLKAFEVATFEVVTAWKLENGDELEEAFPVWWQAVQSGSARDRRRARKTIKIDLRTIRDA